MRSLGLLSALLLLLGCETSTPMTDAGVAPTDAGRDAPPGVDAGRPDAGPVRTDPILPTATGTCPDLSASGTATFAPAGVTPRQVRVLYSDAAATMDGPVVFFWHGAGGSPNEAEYAIGGTGMAAIMDAGGVVIAPFHDPMNTTLPWFLSTGSGDGDLRVADEALACVIEALGIDEHHIHAIGFSAGALHTTQMGFRRASYIASVVTYSGGILNRRMVPPLDAPDARFAAMMLHGGPDDVVVVSFEEATENYLAVARANGHFGFVCDHGMGHTVPTAAPASAWLFLSAHPYGMQPPAYADGLPAGFYAPCALPAP